MDKVMIEKTAMAMAWIERHHAIMDRHDPGVWEYFDRNRARLRSEARRFLRVLERAKVAR